MANHNEEQKTVLAKALDEFHATCARAGISRASADYHVFYQNLIWRSENPAATPPRYKNEQLARRACDALNAGDHHLADQLAQEWLRKTHDVGLGDVAIVRGWAQTREILVDRFELSYSHDDPDTIWMHFEGPTGFDKGVKIKANLVEAHYNVCRSDGPSNRMRKAFPERFLAPHTAAT